jgi:hypothetical protein
MERYKWYELSLPTSLERFLGAVQQLEYKEGQSFGFVKSDADLQKWSFNFVWRSYVSSLSFDEKGIPKFESIPSLNYCNISFFEMQEKIWLRIVNPPRSSRDLLNALETAAGFGFSARPVAFLNRNRLPKFPKGSSQQLISFKAVGDLPKEGAIARIEAASKTGIDLENFSLMQGISYSIDQVTYEITYRLIKGQVCFSSSGTLKISGQLSPLILNSLEADLIIPSTLKQKR